VCERQASWKQGFIIDKWIRHLLGSAVDPWHFGKDPYPRIRTPDLQIPILLFRQWPSRFQQKKIFLRFTANLFFEGTFTSVIKKSQKSKNQGFSLLFLQDDAWIRIRTKIWRGSESGRSKTLRILRIRIRNTVSRTTFGTVFTSTTLWIRICFNADP
jgi:hypothetical protein